MYRLLIVDDEPIIADGLFELFSSRYSDRLEVLRVYTAQDAILIFNRARIDIILSDIEMPGMDGISLMNQVRVHWPYCRIIFLTGHDRFNYAYHAISGGVSAYILKTEPDDRTLDAVDRCIDEIERENSTEEFIQRMRASLEESRILMQREVVHNFLKGKIEVAEAVHKFESLGIPLAATKPSLLVCGRINRLQEKDGIAEKHASIKTLFYQYTRAIGSSYLFFENDERFLHAILQPEANSHHSSSLACEALERMQDACVSVTGLEISFIADDQSIPLERIPERFAELVLFLRYWLNEQSGSQLLQASFFTQRMDAGEMADIRNRTSQNETLELLQAAVEALNPEDFDRALDQLKKILVGTNEQSLLRIELLSAVTAFLAGFINRRNLSSRIPRASLAALSAMVYQSPEEICGFLKELGALLFSATVEADCGRDEVIVQNIHQFVQDHLSQSITLFQVGEYMHFNSAYLSRLYKQITGENLSEAILDIKLTYAREIFRQAPYLKVNEVAEKVGFEYPAYFARVFKKRFGCSPQEYRSQTA